MMRMKTVMAWSLWQRSLCTAAGAQSVVAASCNDESCASVFWDISGRATHLAISRSVLRLCELYNLVACLLI